MQHIKQTFALLLICLVVYSCGGSKKATTDANKTDVVALGGDIYSQNCKGCHSPKNEGNYGAAPNLATTTLDKTELLGIITNGRGRMPAFDTRLSATEIQNTVAYVLSLKEQK
jgi:cytochrome c6